MRRQLTIVASFGVALCSVAASGCQGQVSGDGDGDGGGDGDGQDDEGGRGGSSPAGGRGGAPGGGGEGGGVELDPNAAGPLPFRRLTRREYNNTVRDLLGDATSPGDAFPSDVDETFLFRRAGSVAVQDATTLRTAAEALAANAVKDASKLLPCDPATGEAACARRFIETFGLRAYRRPLSPAEVTRHVALYDTARTKLALPFHGAMGVLVEAMLQAPAFLYHWEVPESGAAKDGDVVRLGPYEIASRLSYFLWGSMPDRELFDAAAANRLANEADVEAQARRMLKDPRARAAVGAFFEDWLDVDKIDGKSKDIAVYPDFNEALRTAMRAELQAFAPDVVFAGDGRFASLFEAKHSFVSEPLAKVYGLTSVRGSTPERVNLDGSQRQGFLTQPGFLALNGGSDGSSPVKRGHMIFERLLCGEMPPPPANVPPLPPPSAGGTTRERSAQHAEAACAKACHEIIDPLGFPFESFDGIGRFRTTDGGKPVDTTATVQLDGAKVPVKNGLELASALGRSKDARSCFATQWLRFALARHEEDSDGAAHAAALASFAEADATVQDLMVAVAKSRSFRFRSPSAGEVLR